MPLPFDLVSNGLCFHSAVSLHLCSSASYSSCRRDSARCGRPGISYWFLLDGFCCPWLDLPPISPVQRPGFQNERPKFPRLPPEVSTPTFFLDFREVTAYFFQLQTHGSAGCHAVPHGHDLGGIASVAPSSYRVCCIYRFVRANYCCSSIIWSSSAPRPAAARLFDCCSPEHWQPPNSLDAFNILSFA